MRLAELDPAFLVIEPGRARRLTDAIAGADGVWFLCPKCFAANGGPVGTHRIICWAPHVPQTEPPAPGRWHLRGTGLGDLSLVGDAASSVLLTGGCAAHFHVRDGAIEGA
jgi:hypothetical protein